VILQIWSWRKGHTNVVTVVGPAIRESTEPVFWPIDACILAHRRTFASFSAPLLCESRPPLPLPSFDSAHMLPKDPSVPVSPRLVSLSHCLASSHSAMTPSLSKSLQPRSAGCPSRLIFLLRRPKILPTRRTSRHLPGARALRGRAERPTHTMRRHGFHPCGAADTCTPSNSFMRKVWSGIDVVTLFGDCFHDVFQY